MTRPAHIMSSMFCMTAKFTTNFPTFIGLTFCCRSLLIYCMCTCILYTHDIVCMYVCMYVCHVFFKGDRMACGLRRPTNMRGHPHMYVPSKLHHTSSYGSHLHYNNINIININMHCNISTISVCFFF